ncbi:hypothetical protein [Mesorhizobium sp. INR15]|uniref:hypothetical protein n=1 Tax=Mesorhizobium sp. INR15 TaxID=2654248 RepID=UPI0018966276|nr:hypothetical protein [Mesorhizobium sp. INR15]QPC93534.1 hypothetical protein GA829_24795 [Mesorhizobium sp. INR15]
MPKNTEAFEVPSLAEVDPEYARLDAQFHDLNSQKAATDREFAVLREELAGTRGPVLSDSVAALVGEAPSSLTGKRQRAAELSKLSSDLATAIDLVGKRLRERRDLAKRPLIAAVREEYASRAAAAATALEAALEPLRAIEELQRDFDANDIAGSFEWPQSNISHFAVQFIEGNVRKGIA